MTVVVNVVLPACVWTAAGSVSYLSILLLAGKRPSNRSLVCSHLTMFGMFSLLFWQDMRLLRRREEALCSLKTGSMNFLALDSLAPSVPVEELDSATGQNAEDAVEDLIKEAQSKVRHEELTHKRLNWWKLKSL